MLATTFRARRIGRIGTQWRPIFEDYWPAYRAWYRQKKQDLVNPRELQQGYRQLRRHMPELLPLYEGFRDKSNDCPVAAQFLTGYQPPAYLVSCSQAVLLDEEPVLIRNYDLSPALSENLLTHSDWLQQEIIGSNECLWGLDDGMNRSGLAASLTFGGSDKVGPGFGIPFILRYVLQTCINVRQAIKVLQRLPSHMAYNVTLLDRWGDYATVMLAPGQDANVTRERCITNHQGNVTWPRQAAFSKTLERKKFLDELLANETLNEQQLRAAFLAAPVRSSNYAQSFGTVYTALYRPSSESMTYHWPAGQDWRHRFIDFGESEKTVMLGKYSKTGTVPAQVVTPARPGPELSADIRRYLLQGLQYLPASATAQPAALQQLKRNLRAGNRICWTDYARQLADVWRDPATSN